MASSTMTSKGQMTVPKAIRDRFQLAAGDRIDFVVDDDRIMLVPAKYTLDDLMTVLPKPKRRVTLEEMEATIRARGGRGPR